MRRKKQQELRRLLKNFRSDDVNKISEAGTSIYRFDNVPIQPLIAILEKFPNAKSREYAAYGLISVLLDLESKEHNRSYRRNNSKRTYKISLRNRNRIDKVIKSLIKTVKFDESPTVKAQALETLGMSSKAETKFYKLRGAIEKTVITALSDESAEVRFWACYAAGQLAIENALPKLRELVENDTEDWEQWWYISEEAEDAIDWIYGRETEFRIPLAQRKKVEDS